jgi:hypothetical protein
MIDIGCHDKTARACRKFIQNVANAGLLVDCVDLNSTEADFRQRLVMNRAGRRSFKRRDSPRRFRGNIPPPRFAFFHMHDTAHPNGAKLVCDWALSRSPLQTH